MADEELSYVQTTEQAFMNAIKSFTWKDAINIAALIGIGYIIYKLTEEDEEDLYDNYHKQFYGEDTDEDE